MTRLTAMQDAFLSGIVIPLVPFILEKRAGVQHEQIQVWAAIFVASYGGAFAVVSPLMPFLAPQGPLAWVALLAGLALAGSAFGILQFYSSSLFLLLISRALQGLGSAATNATCSTILATAAGVYGTANTLSWVNSAVVQSFAMAAAPLVSGYLSDYIYFEAIFYLAYSLLAFTALLSLVAAIITPSGQAATGRQEAVLVSDTSGYGTISSGETSPRATVRPDRASSRRSSPSSAASRRSSSFSAISAEPSSWSLQLLIAGFGFLVIGLLSTALQTVLPILVKQKFNWSVSATGLMFLALSGPAFLVGPLTGALAARVPASSRYLTTIGFLASVPAFLYLGGLTENTQANQQAFLITLAGLSLALGISGDPLIKEITRAVGPSATNDASNAAAQASSLPSIAYAWGGLIGPLLAGDISWIWGWETLTKVLAYVSALAGVLSLLFLHGWVGSPNPDTHRRPRKPSSDEESAPLLGNDRQGSDSQRDGEQAAGPAQSKKIHPYASILKNSNSASRKERSHRRHFSVDNFSVATTAAPGSLDSSTSQVRFQVALETAAEGSSESPKITDNSRTNHERRYVMREAPHAPATDPLLASGSRYVIDEERSIVPEGERPKRHVVVFAEGTAPPELLERHPHHIVAINALDGSAQVVSSESTDNHSVSVMEETGEELEFPETNSRRYVVVVVDEASDSS